MTARQKIDHSELDNKSGLFPGEQVHWTEYKRAGFRLFGVWGGGDSGFIAKPDIKLLAVLLPQQLSAAVIG